MNNRPIFSILHPSARPEQWRKVYDDWMGKCADPSKVEYVLCWDARWGFEPRSGHGPSDQGGKFVNVENTGRRCYVDAVNTAAKAATGHILIVIADDQFACDGWDLRLLEALPARGFKSLAAVIDWEEFVVEVSTGTPAEHERGIFVMPIVSRARYERLGYLFYPEYESMYADNDLCQHARQDGVVVDTRHLMFPHKHYLNTPGVVVDDAYAEQNRMEAYRIGKQVFETRKRERFAPKFYSPVQSTAVPVASTEGAQGQTVAICYPGEHFSSEWVSGILRLFAHLMSKGIQVQLCPCYTSNVYHTRMEVTRMLMTEPNKPDYVLWLDDDNIATPEHFDQLFADLQEFTDVDVMAGWCWIHFTQKNQMFPSCGNMQDGRQLWHDGPSWAALDRVARIDWTGFPFILMRYAALEKAGGVKAWLPLLDERYQIGMTGEDLSWSIRAAENGVVLAADPRVRVEHMKTVALTPFIPSAVQSPAIQQASTPSAQGQTRKPVRIAGMLRVKNEGRWIKRVIESIRPLCDAGVFVMDDGSTDDTRRICELMGGVRVMGSPFEGRGLDEARDKNYLMAHIIGAKNPDWILCIDGDEELVAGDGERLRSILETTDLDSFALKIMYLWDKPELWRTDGCYGKMFRHSVFRPRPDAVFKSLYTGATNPVHTGLHVTNAPLWTLPDAKFGNLPDVRLLHYGYMDREDRIRKYEWYNKIDPNNQAEDGYRHIVQGDLPIAPAKAKLMHAGPLKLDMLPIGAAPDLFAPFEDIRESALRQVTSICSEPKRLNLGCSDRLESGWTNVDICEPADQLADLRQDWPWDDSSISEIRAYDIIEHLSNQIHTMNEAFRVLKPGGRLDIIVPTTEGRGAFQDPTHVSFWNRNSFFYFEAGNPHLHRFEKAYGMRCAFRVVRESEETLADGVTKLHIVLEAVKESALSNAAD